MQSATAAPRSASVAYINDTLPTVTAMTALALLLLAPCADPNGVKFKPTDTGVEIDLDGKPWTALVAKKPGLAKPYLYPILAPCGVPVTRDWPMKTGSADETKDHVHQKSAWHCHGDVIPDGVTLKVKSSDKRVKGVDFWAESAGHGSIVAVSDSIDDSAYVLRLEWKAPEGLTVLHEKRSYAFAAVAGGRLITVTSTVTAKEFGVTFGDTKEGSFGIRVNDTMRMTNKAGDGLLTNSNGKSGMKDCWGYLADWCDYSGTVAGKKVGVAVFDHPKNAHRSYWHARDYGLLAANPFGRTEAGFPGAKDKTGLVKLAKDESLTLTYAIFAHDGDAKAGQVAAAFAAFAK
jgi:hypothetical protein